jgi:hypothetical protein
MAVTAFAEFDRAVERELKARGLDPMSDKDRAKASRRVANAQLDLLPRLR